MDGARLGKAEHNQEGYFQQRSGNEQQSGGSNPNREQGGQRRSADRSHCPTHPDEPKQPLALLAAEVIRDEGPKDGNDEQVVDAGPDEERTPQPGLFGGGEGAREHVKEQEVENEELVGDADELLDAKMGNQHRE